MLAPLLASYPECAPEDAISCRVVFRWTDNEALADVATWLIGKPLSIAVLVLIAWAARWVINRFIDRLVRQAEEGSVTSRVGRMTLGGRQTGRSVDSGEAAGRRVQRARTMGSLLKSIATGIITAVVVMMAIAELGYNVGPLLASAGIVGVALGFGAQSLVKDFLSGIFMIFEDQYGVGDVVDVGEATGTIEAVSLRVTRLRDTEGTVWYVRNGEILRVGNMSQNWARTVLDVAVAYSEDLTRVRTVLKEVAHDLWEDDDFRGLVIEEPEVWGVQSVGPDGVVLRVAVKTAPQQQWAVGRELRQRIKARFDHEGIHVPYPEWVTRTPGSGAPRSDVDLGHSPDNAPGGGPEQ
ncbi:mechanosensitive ion channel family protein [Nocardioides daejeonensis]|uniref:mechanosensitive ion channel family protein n=1 Tax=Nocardioides daejeonensis TaxID=1046556 RepID=UPI000D750201|nr:mechanosensitive ion channel family protein [Nocardioides daejeonensis]